MTEERRLIAAFALSFVVLLGYRNWMDERYGARISTPPATDVKPPAGAKAPGPAPATPPSGPARPAPAAPQTPSREAIHGDEQRVEIATSTAEIAFASRGGRLLSWRLLDHRDDRGRPMEMLPGVVASPGPLDLATESAELTSRLGTLPFRVTRERRADGERVSFVYQDDTLRVEKIVETIRDGRAFRVDGRVTANDQPVPTTLRFGPGLGQATAEEKAVQGYLPPQIALHAHGAEVRVPAKDLVKRVERATHAAIETKYFAGIFAREDGAEFETTLIPLDPAGDEPRAAIEVPLPITLTVAAKDYHQLERIGLGGEKLVPIGSWIGPIVLPLMQALRAVNERIGNYGWSIVLLTLGISLAMAPLRQYSIISGAKMAKIAPQLRAVQERYKRIGPTDPRYQDMQKELQEVYSRNGMDMMKQMAAGCLPALLTMPFLFAFYRMLDLSVDLKGAAFLWIPDLSLKDPIYLTPILTGVSMYAMQKMMPAAPDPAQQRMLMMMPVLITTFSALAPAGLNVYWFVSNLFAMAQQGLTMTFAPHLFPKPKPER